MKKRIMMLVSLLLCAATLLTTACTGGKNSGTETSETPTGSEDATTAENETVEPLPAWDMLSEYDPDGSDFQLTVDAGDEVHEISELLFGIFFEDINFAADGGLYAEMVKNRSFEFTEIAKDDQKHGWRNVGKVSAEVTIGDRANGLNINNTNYMVIRNAESERGGIANEGFLDGMSVTKNAEYNFSIYAKGIDGYTGPVYVDITLGSKSIASGVIESITDKWEKYTLTLTAKDTVSSNCLLKVTIDKGAAAVDMVSLFPKDTYKGRENGLRRDLAEKLEALHPAFVRFPGGCVIEGQRLEWAYDWKDSIGVDENGEPLLFNGTYGDVAARKQELNNWMPVTLTDDPWPSYMSYGLGFYEFFLLCEDIDALAVPVLNCGLSHSDGVEPGTREFYKYVDDLLDLVEFCRGGSDTTWGAVRIAMGHEEPFELHYIGVGNEQVGGDYYRRYEAFVNAFETAKRRDPDLYDGIELMYSSGFDDGDSGSTYIQSYIEAQRWLDANPSKTLSDFAGATDHHYYNTPDWFFEHTNYYDPENYSRDSLTDTVFGGQIPVFLGEYAAQSNKWNAALAEAAYMTGLERNGDIVVMAAYAPLFGNATANHWTPDLIWFNNHTSQGSGDYYVQSVFSNNAGTKLLGTTFTGEGGDVDMTLRGKVGLGTWNTSAYFDNVKVVDNKTGEVLGEQDFETDTFDSDWERVSDGSWAVSEGKLVQSSRSTNFDQYFNTGSAVYFGDGNWTDYTFTVDATKTDGDEGFLIPFAVGDKDNNFFWNIGGWSNTVSTLQRVSNGVKSDAIAVTSKPIHIHRNQTYHLKVVVSGNNVKCYIDDELYVDFNVSAGEKADVYQVVSTDETGDIIIKLVNVTSSSKTVAIDLKNADAAGNAHVEIVRGDNLDAENIVGEDEEITLESMEVGGFSDQFNLKLQKYSVTVIRIKR